MNPYPPWSLHLCKNSYFCSYNCIPICVRPIKVILAASVHLSGLQRVTIKLLAGNNVANAWHRAIALCFLIFRLTLHKLLKEEEEEEDNEDDDEDKEERMGKRKNFCKRVLCNNLVNAINYKYSFTIEWLEVFCLYAINQFAIRWYGLHCVFHSLQSTSTNCHQISFQGNTLGTGKQNPSFNNMEKWASHMKFCW